MRRHPVTGMHWQCPAVCKPSICSVHRTVWLWACDAKSTMPVLKRISREGCESCKKDFKETTEVKEDFWLGPLNYRASSLEDGWSPGKLLQGRHQRILLPNFTHHPVIRVTKHSQTIQNHRPLPLLKRDDIVGVKEKLWLQKNAVTTPVGPWSFIVRRENDRTIRWNQCHLLATRESQSTDLSLSDTDDEQVLSSASSETTNTEVAAGQSPPTLVLRRSQRQLRPPKQLMYGANFKQIIIRWAIFSRLL